MTCESCGFHSGEHGPNCQRPAFHLTHEQYRIAVESADVKMKETNGHSFLRILKTRCRYCGRSPRQKGQCRAWINRFVDCLYEELGVPLENHGGNQ